MLLYSSKRQEKTFWGMDENVMCALQGALMMRLKLSWYLWPKSGRKDSKSQKLQICNRNRISSDYSTETVRGKYCTGIQLGILNLILNEPYRFIIWQIEWPPILLLLLLGIMNHLIQLFSCHLCQHFSRLLMLTRIFLQSQCKGAFYITFLNNAMQVFKDQINKTQISLLVKLQAIRIEHFFHYSSGF